LSGSYRLLLGDHLGGFAFQRMPGKKLVCLGIGRQQDFDFAAQSLITCTSFGQQRRTFRYRALQRRVIKLLDSLPAFRRHGKRC
jgi:hypothetical protein